MSRRGYTQLAEPIPIELIVGAMKRGEEVYHVPGIGDISISSVRMRTYTKGTACVTCNKEASFFILEKQRNGGNGHFNLYIDQGTGGLKMMTSDHIIAKSRGGHPTALENRQPMCCTCNFRKGNLLPGETHEQRRAENAEHRIRKTEAEAALSLYSKLVKLLGHARRGLPLDKFFMIRAKGLTAMSRKRHLFTSEQWNDLQEKLLVV